jgi:hypothetical protein
MHGNTSEDSRLFVGGCPENDGSHLSIRPRRLQVNEP